MSASYVSKEVLTEIEGEKKKKGFHERHDKHVSDFSS